MSLPSATLALLTSLLIYRNGFDAMSFRSVTLAVFSALLLIGCATQEQQSTARKSASEDVKGGWDEFRSWNRMGADHVKHCLRCA